MNEYYIDCDMNGFDYVIPVSKMEEFENWVHDVDAGNDEYKTFGAVKVKCFNKVKFSNWEVLE